MLCLIQILPTERVQELTTRNSQSYEQGKRRLVMARLQMIRVLMRLTTIPYLQKEKRNSILDFGSSFGND
jgi:hypothetical protein